MSAKDSNPSLESALNGGDVTLRRLLDALPHMIWVASADRGCEFVNQRWLQYTGARADELLGYGWMPFIHPDDLEHTLADWRKATPTGTGFQHHSRIRRHDGEYRWFVTQAITLGELGGRVGIKWFGTSTDVHDAFAARDALAKNEERLRYVELATNDCIYDWDLRAGWTRRNEAYQEQFGAPPEVRTTEDWWQQRIHPDDRDRVIESTHAAVRARQSTWQAEYRLRKPDGAYADVVDCGYLLYDADGKLARMIGAVADIGKQKQIEQSLRDAQGRLLSAIEAGGMATWIWDIPTDALLLDEAAYRLWGRSKEELEHITLTRMIDYVHPQDREAMALELQEVLRTGVGKVVEFRTIRPDGAVQWLQARGRFEHDASGKPIRMAGVYIDITDRKRIEEAQLRAQKMEALGTLAGGIAHDFNNILLAISGNVRLAIEDARAALPHHASLQRSLEEIERAGARATDLVKRILTFSRQQDAQRETMQLRPIVEDALRLLRPMVPANVEFRTVFADDVPAVSTDSIQIHQLVMNLVTNAAHAIGGAPGFIDIHLERCVLSAAAAHKHHDLAPGLYARLVVKDSGSGIHPAMFDRIFEPFFTTKQAGQGTGLGLAVVHGIVKAHGGAIDIESNIGKGATFRIMLPASQEEEIVPEVPSTTPARGAGERVLYVDDEEALVFLVARVLERLGYRVTGCIDPVQALDEIKKEPRSFDVLITDLSMRGMNGFELARAARKLRPDLPVLLTSGYLRSEDREMAAHCGIREMILKPNTVEELGQAIDRELHALRTNV